MPDTSLDTSTARVIGARRVPRRYPRMAAAAAALAVLTVAGCGTEGSGGGTSAEGSTAPSDGASPSASPSPSSNESGSPQGSAPALPDCSDVWKGDKLLPRGYQGCTEKSGEVAAGKPRGCSSGQSLVTYGGRYYAVLGGPINDVGSLDKSAKWKKISRSCVG